jgi:hypothetical protein
LGAGGRRFESYHPDSHNVFYMSNLPFLVFPILLTFSGFVAVGGFFIVPPEVHNGKDKNENKQSGICHELARQGRRVYFSTCDLIVQQLLRAKRELELDKLLKKLSRFDALMIDDFGYVKQDRDEMEVLFTLLVHRYERGSMLLTSNLPFSKWEVIFKDPMTTAAAIDRLVHHSVVLELNVPSYRAEEARKRKSRVK